MNLILGALAVAATFATAAHAETKATTTKTAIDLDHMDPAELLVNSGDSHSILYWSIPNAKWLEIFRSNVEIDGIADDPQSALGEIKSGGRFWQWRNDIYVPLVAEQTIFSGPLSDDLFAKAVKFIGDFDQTPDNSAANMEFSISIAGKTDIAAVLGGTVFCSMGGTECPIIFFQDGEPRSLIYVNMGQQWGVSSKSNKHGFPYIESQQERSLLLIDSETGTTDEMAGISPKVADSQPLRPKDLPQ